MMRDPTARTAPLGASAEERRRLMRERARERKRRVARRNRQLALLGGSLLLAVALLIGARVARPDAEQRIDGPGAASMPPRDAWMAVAALTDADPSPLFASYRSLHLYLPVPASALTEIAFHQASGDAALHMTSMLPDADMSSARRNHGTGRPPAVDEGGLGPQILQGSVLRLWRSNRSGPPDTAVDVGAAPGTAVLAPVTGRVVKVRAYKLYGQYDDFEVHIQPNGWADVDVVLIHIDDVQVKEGDTVIGGCTRIAQVRRLSDRVTPQIAAYTRDGGDHVHLQLNKVDVPGKLEGVGGS